MVRPVPPPSLEAVPAAPKISHARECAGAEWDGRSDVEPRPHFHAARGDDRAVSRNRLSDRRERRHGDRLRDRRGDRSEEHTSELQSLMRISYAVFCLKQKINKIT